MEASLARHVGLWLFVMLSAFGATGFSGASDKNASETPRIQSVIVSPNTVDAGAGPSMGTVTLTFAPASNVSINLRSSSPQAATVPSVVMVPKGQTQATFSVTIGKPSVTITTSITAMLGSSMTGANLVVKVPLAVKVQSVSLSPMIVAAGGKVLAMVKLNALAPAGGQLVNLIYHPASLVSGPPSVIVPERAVATEVQVQAGSPVNQTTAEIRASIDSIGFSAVLTIRGSAPITPTTAFISPSRLKSQDAGTLTIQLSSPAPSGGCIVSLSSSESTVVTVPANLTVPAGEITGRASVMVKPVQKSGTVTVTATLNGGSAKALVEIVGTSK
jgi:hypothetical protein